MQNETSDTIQNSNTTEISEENLQPPAIYRKRFERKQPAYDLGHFEYSESHKPSGFTLSTGEKLTINSEINDISDEFFNDNSEKNYSQKKFWAILKRILTEQRVNGIHSSSAIELESSGFDPDIEVSGDDLTVKFAIGDTSIAQYEMNHIVLDELLKWFDNLSSENKKVLLKKIDIPTLNVSFQTIVIGSVEQTHDFWSVDEQIVNMLYFIRKTLNLSLPESFQIFVIATLDSYDLKNQQLSSDLIEMCDVLGMSNQNSAIIFEQGVFSMDRNSNKMIKIIDSLQSQEVTTHEIAHICDSNISQSTVPQIEAFAVALDVGMNFQKIINLIIQIRSQKKEITTRDLEELFAAKPPNHLKPWQVYGLSAALYCYIYEQFGPQKFVQFYHEITKNINANNLITALQNIGALDQYKNFIQIINQAIVKKQKTV